MCKYTKADLIPIQLLVERFLGRPVVCRIQEDNTAAITAVRKGYAPTLRHLAKTHKTSLGFLHELLCFPEDDPSTVKLSCKFDDSTGLIYLHYRCTDEQKGDIFTKCLTPQKFRIALELIKVLPISEKLSWKDRLSVVESVKSERLKTMKVKP